MIYSVWNQADQAFDLYQDARAQPELNAPAPTHLDGRGHALGATVDQAAWPLPADARKIGTSAVPVGRVAARAALGDVAGVPLATIGLAIAAGLATWHLTKRRRR